MKEDGDCRKKTRAQWVKGQGASKLVFIFDILPRNIWVFPKIGVPQMDGL